MARFVCLVALVASLLAPRMAAAAPEGQLTWGIHITLAPTYFDPAETPGLVTPFMILYALHDALVKPMPGQPSRPRWRSRGPCRRTGWSTSSSCARA